MYDDEPNTFPSRKTVWCIVSAALLVVIALAEIAPRLSAEPQGSRNLDREIELMVELMELEPGSRVADVGADDGLYAVRLARQVGADGRVWANEITERQVAEIRARAHRAGIDNLEAVLASDGRSGLPARCCDALVLRVVYHHLARPETMLRQFHQALPDGGRLLIIENRPQGGPNAPGVPDNRSGMGIDRDIVADEVTGAGFELVRELDDWPSGRYGGHYALLFVKSE